MRHLAPFLLAAVLLAPGLRAQDADPTTGKDLVSTLEADGSFTVLVDALERTGLAASLAAGGPYTLFAPTDDAFAALAPGTLDGLTPDQLADLLQNHVVEGAVTADQAAARAEAQTALGSTLALRTEAGTLYVGDAAVVQPGLAAGHGIIHAIDAVLMPAADLGAAEAAPSTTDAATSRRTAAPVADQPAEDQPMEDQ